MSADDGMTSGASAMTDGGPDATSLPDSTSAATSDDTATNASSADDATDSSSGNGGVGFCECLEELPTDAPNVCQPIAQQCDAPADCCPDPMPPGFTCMEDHPYLFACENQECVVQQCDASEQCEAYGALTMATSSSCEETQGPCGSTMSCQFTYGAPTGCTSDADCCAAPPPYVCGQDYPYLVECIDQACVYQGCESDAQCDAYATQMGMLNLGCATPPIPECWELPDAPPYEPVAACSFALSCRVDADCCPDPMPPGFTCLEDYPYMYTCNAGECALQACESDDQCESYGAQLGQPLECG